MNIDANLLGQAVFILAIVFAGLGFYLGKRKTQTPILVSVLAFFSAVAAPLGLIFLMALTIKNDLPKAQKITDISDN
ncbi:hypothetical protein HUZ36_12240 [Pseudoalteromonas sp. McH1-7]|uniref:hypothetical protein n=1 Tax=unclassified Pseudoalteromonas TaxID=194690 RepID=UPI000F649DD8|nr:MULTISPECIES: hypothetical protein [unclassified Pseudoalteromonas]NUZ11546.1 hypothetical protein [Pseudoalteromonas sp. McH1-7]RRS10465.1 hypothetical protein EAG18_00045 [Pseudoalteromonas sp. J010]RXE98996.1 hypothetical protein D9603_16820 [Pseudoalteromonas sp. PS5]USD29358.1 hypothetical protein J8Z24_04525 [Pseudoalteromonas sp. SCSIO 43201]